jgi:hypothetical protein
MAKSPQTSHCFLEIFSSFQKLSSERRRESGAEGEDARCFRQSPWLLIWWHQNAAAGLAAD